MTDLVLPALREQMQAENMSKVGSVGKGRTARYGWCGLRPSGLQVRNNSADSSQRFPTRTRAHAGAAYLAGPRERRVARLCAAVPRKTRETPSWQRPGSFFLGSTGWIPPRAGGGPGGAPSSGSMGALPPFTP